jgi:hypothetical protein
LNVLCFPGGLRVHSLTRAQSKDLGALDIVWRGLRAR